MKWTVPSLSLMKRLKRLVKLSEREKIIHTDSGFQLRRRCYAGNFKKIRAVIGTHSNNIEQQLFDIGFIDSRIIISAVRFYRLWSQCLAAGNTQYQQDKC